MRGISVRHPFFDRLKRIDALASRLFPARHDPGLGAIGLILDDDLDRSRHPVFTPTNCLTFASTGGEGVHFSFLVHDEKVDEDSAIMMTVPATSWTIVVGENLLDFLCFGARRGYFSLEELAYDPRTALRLFTSRDWEPPEPYEAAAYALGDHERQVLDFLTQELGLTPWDKPSRFQDLQRRFGPLLRFRSANKPLSGRFVDVTEVLNSES